MNNDTTLDELVKFLDRQPGSRPKAIAEALGISRQYVQKLLVNNKDQFAVSGTGPNRFYRNIEKSYETINKSKENSHLFHNINKEDAQLIENNYYSLSPLGEELTGIQGLIKWSIARKLDPAVKQEEYVAILKKYYPPNFESPIDFTEKVKRTFNDFALNKVWAIDFYNFEVFGRTKLGTQVMVVKQTGDAETANILVDRLETATNNILSKYNIGAVAFVSPTIQRQSQLMTKLENNVAVKTPRIKVHKVGARILIAQKTLKSLEDRLLNASQTFIVESREHYDNVLIIDDALGSGATLNEIAKQIKQKNIANNCFGLVLVSSPSGYEVINEV